MNQGGGDDAEPRSRRHRHDTDAPEGLSVADLLARHGVATGEGAAANRHRLVNQPPIAPEQSAHPDADPAPPARDAEPPAQAARQPSAPPSQSPESHAHTSQTAASQTQPPPAQSAPPPAQAAPPPSRPAAPEGRTGTPSAAEPSEPAKPAGAQPPARHQEPPTSAPGRTGQPAAPPPPARSPHDTGGQRRPGWESTQSGFKRGFTLPPHPSANLFAQLGKAEPDDSPTDVVPKVTDGDPPEPEAAAKPDAKPEPKAESKPDAEPEPDKPADAQPADARPAGDTEAEPADDEKRGFELRTQRIDESLTRLTAIHAGLGKEMTERVSRTRGLPVVDRTAEPPADPDADLDDDPAGPAWLRRSVKGLALAAGLAVFLAAAGGWGTRAWLDGKLRTVAALDPGSESVIDPVSQAGDQNYLLVGLDPSNQRPGPRDLPPGPRDPGPRDVPPGPRDPGVLPTSVPSPALPPGVHGGGPGTVMLAHVPARRDHVVLLAFPGDLAVDRPSCDRWDQASGTYPGGTSPAQTGVQLASTYTIGGPRCVTKTIQKITGIDVNHYTDIDLAALKDMVDAVHGVSVCDTVLAGDQALAYARAQRVGTDPTPGLGPIQRQQLLLTDLLRTAGSAQVLTNLSGLTEFVTAFGDATHTDNTGLEALGTLAEAIRSVDPAKISFATVPTLGPPDLQGNELMQVDAGVALFAAIRTKRPLPSSNDGVDGRTPGPANAGTLPPRAVTLQIRNGSTKRGQGNSAADSLRTLGFVVTTVGDAPPSPGGRTVIRHSPDRADQAAALAAAVPSAVVEEAPGTTGLVELVLGDSFDGQVRAAPTAGPAAPAGGPGTVTSAAASCG